MAKRGDYLLEYDSFRTRIGNRNFDPIYFFFGEEEFLAEEGVRMIIDAALEADSGGFDIDVLYGPDSDAHTIISHARSFPMVNVRRVVIVRDVEHLPSKELLEAYAQHPSETTILVLVAQKPDLRTKPYPALKQAARWVECRPLRDNEIPSWITTRVQAKGRRISPDACALMQDYVGNSLREIDNEIEKLFIFIGDKREVDENDVSEVVGMSKQYNVFELQRAIGRRDAKLSFEILERMLQAGDSPVMMIAILTRFFLNLYKIHILRSRRRSNRDIAGAIRANPNFIHEYMANADRHPLVHVERCFAHLVEADETLKSTSVDPKLVMSVLTYQLVRG